MSRAGMRVGTQTCLRRRLIGTAIFRVIHKRAGQQAAVETRIDRSVACCGFRQRRSAFGTEVSYRVKRKEITREPAGASSGTIHGLHPQARRLSIARTQTISAPRETATSACRPAQVPLAWLGHSHRKAMAVMVRRISPETSTNGTLIGRKITRPSVRIAL